MVLAQILAYFSILAPGPQILGIFLHQFRVLGHQVEHIGPIRAGGISQVDHRHLVAIALLCDGAVVAVDVAFGVGYQEAHPGGAGVLQVGGRDSGRSCPRRKRRSSGSEHPKDRRGRWSFSLAPGNRQPVPAFPAGDGSAATAEEEREPAGRRRGSPSRLPSEPVPCWPSPTGRDLKLSRLPCLGEDAALDCDRKNRHNDCSGQENVRKGRKIKGEHGIPPFLL